MFKLLFFLHLLTAVFAVGPLVHLSTTAARGLRQQDASATAAAARGTRLYAMVSVAVVIFGFGLMSQDAPWAKGQKVAEFGDPYIWLSTLLWLVAAGLAIGVLSPTLEKAAARIGAGESVDGERGKVAAIGGVIGLVFAVIVFLMVYKPGS